MPAEAGSLLSLIPPEIQPPAQAPAAPLEAKDVDDPPLPAVAKVNESVAAGGPAASAHSSALANAANVGLSLVTIVMLSLLSFQC